MSTNRSNNFDEQKLINIVRPYFKAARAGDWEHALRVVKWVKELGQNRQDLYLLLTAAYLHDIGWSGVAPAGKIDLDEMLKLEPEANKNSPIMIERALGELNFSNSEIQTVNRLVSATDKHESEQPDEEIIVDADSLSQLCVEHLNDKYQPESYTKVIKLWEEELKRKTKTVKARKLFLKLLTELKEKIAVANL